MSQKKLPDTIDYQIWKKGDGDYVGVYPIEGMPRLAKLLTQSEGVLEVKLSFIRDDEQRHVLLGQLDGQLHIECQRCLRPMPFSLNAKFQLCAVNDVEEAKVLPESFEPMLFVETKHGLQANLQEIVEDEVLLSLPIVARHEQNDCNTNNQYYNDLKSNEAVTQSLNPFSVLKTLKDNA